MFKFGENWASFSRQLDETRIDEAIGSLTSLFGDGMLKEKSFLDIGCGSGLFSIAAVRCGARLVTGIDVDPVSVRVSRQNADRWLRAGGIAHGRHGEVGATARLGNGQKVSFQHASALDDSFMETIGKFDVVYSWGVLHHSGDMHHALANAARAVKPSGLLMIAIYNRHWSSGAWKAVKWLYNRAGPLGQKLIIWLLTPVIFLAKWLVTFKNPFAMRRGMDFMHNVIDWVGGYPYEYASVEEMTAALEKLGFEMLQVRPANVPTGCNEFVCKKLDQ